MSAPEYRSIQQLRINDRGELEPVTWDGEPLLSPATSQAMTAEQLFNVAAFDQIRGQLAIETDDDGC